MRWKAHFFLQKETKAAPNNNFGLPSTAFAPPIAELKAFEDDLLSLTSNITFREVKDPFLKRVQQDMKEIRLSKDVYVFADKSTNLYTTTVDNYNKLLQENVTKTYKIADENATDNINEELQEITRKLSISNRVNIMGERDAYITLKDHKENFQSNPKFRLINPSKSELGKVSKLILDDINNNVRAAINVNQWKNSHSVIEWFKSLENKSTYTFLSFDVVEFYPSITEELLNKVIEWAKTITPITDQQVSIIHHARKSLLFHNNTSWVKKNNDSMFDVTMGSFDGAEICDLVGLFLLNDLAKKFGSNFVGLYRDDGLALLKTRSARIADKVRKEMHELFSQQNLKITSEINNQIVNFLDITLNLADGTFSPYKKPNSDPLYINKNSNHPPAVIKQLPKSINKRISSLSSTQSCFNSVAPIYADALKRSGYDETLTYNETNIPFANQSSRKTRSRNIIWFNPPFSKSVKTNVAGSFLRLIDKHFPPSNPLRKIFNRNNVKVSYSCMGNMKSTISSHNRQVLKQTRQPNTTNCNCIVKDECPLNGKCLTSNVVYKADITTEDGDGTKVYVGMTSNPFKIRYRNHIKSFNHPNYSTETELSKYVWELKNKNKQFNIKWSIIKCASSHAFSGMSCNLCIEEKLQIMKAKTGELLNKRSELFSKCRHREKFRVWNFKRKKIAQAHKHATNGKRQRIQ